MKRGLKGLITLAKDKEHFNHCIDLINNKAKIFWQMYGFDFRKFREGIPKSEEKLFNSLDPIFQKDKLIVKKAIGEFLDYIQEAEIKLSLIEKDFFGLMQEINDKDIRNYIEKNKQFIGKNNLVEYILKNRNKTNDRVLKNRNIRKKGSRELENLIDEVYHIFIERGEEHVKEYLTSLNARKDVIDNWLLKFKDNHDKFTGRSSRVFSSEDETNIENALLDNKVFHRRHTKYSELYETNKRYSADFVFYLKNNKRLVVEYAPIFGDEIIHDLNYEERLKHKRKIVEDAGDEFIEIHEFSIAGGGVEKLVERLKKQAIMPKEAYELKKPKFKDYGFLGIEDNEPFKIGMKIYQTYRKGDKLQMIGYLKLKVLH